MQINITKSAEGFQKQAVSQQDEMQALRSAGGYIAKGIGQNQKELKKV